MHQLHILTTNTHAPGAAQMPSRHRRQVLNHDPAQHDEFCLDAIQDRVVAEVESVGYFAGDPFCDTSKQGCVLVTSQPQP